MLANFVYIENEQVNQSIATQDKCHKKLFVSCTLIGCVSVSHKTYIIAHKEIFVSLLFGNRKYQALKTIYISVYTEFQWQAIPYCMIKLSER